MSPEYPKNNAGVAEISPDNKPTISEVADWLGVKLHELRYWENKFTQIQPIIHADGQRRYSPENVQLLAGLRQLLVEDRMTIKGARKLLRERGVAYVSSLATIPQVADVSGTATGHTFPRSLPPDHDIEVKPGPLAKMLHVRQISPHAARQIRPLLDTLRELSERTGPDSAP